MAQYDDTSHDRRTLRDMLGDVRFWRSHGGRFYENREDVTDSWIGSQLKRARHLWRVIAARERRDD
jgi:hypothetical protein